MHAPLPEAQKDQTVAWALTDLGFTVCVTSNPSILSLCYRRENPFLLGERLIHAGTSDTEKGMHRHI